MEACNSDTKAARPLNRILVIDDDDAIRDLCAAVLKDSGYEVETAPDGEAGWRALNAVSSDSDRYDLLITDHNMPKLSGLDLVRKLRAARMDVPVVLVSGDLPPIIKASVSPEVPLAELEWNRSLRLAGALEKPFTLDDLLRTVKKILPSPGPVNAPREK
jgi:CheY-like chemotaxis protein